MLGNAWQETRDAEVSVVFRLRDDDAMGWMLDGESRRELLEVVDQVLKQNVVRAHDRLRVAA
jgi:hypothetical protein